MPQGITLDRACQYYKDIIEDRHASSNKIQLICESLIREGKPASFLDQSGNNSSAEVIKILKVKGTAAALSSAQFWFNTLTSFAKEDGRIQNNHLPSYYVPFESLIKELRFLNSDATILAGTSFDPEEAAEQIGRLANKIHPLAASQSFEPTYKPGLKRDFDKAAIAWMVTPLEELIEQLEKLDAPKVPGQNHQQENSL